MPHPPFLLHDLIHHAAARDGNALALEDRRTSLDYATLETSVARCSSALRDLGLQPDERVAVYLPKAPEAVIALFGASHAGGVFVPVNPALKPHQVAYILQDCNVRVLVTSTDRLKLLDDALAACRDLHSVIVTGDGEVAVRQEGVAVHRWDELVQGAAPAMPYPRIDGDMAAILYTSGSTGRPKGVVLSHRNMVTGARSVAQYLENTAEDRLLAVLPLSFDYGLSQLTTAFSVGASVTLMDYLLPRDVIKAVVRHRITGLAAVPPLWTQLARLDWPSEAADCLRYITNSGGAMPVPVTQALQAALPNTRIYLMYGLTEAFRSTYLPPEQVAIRPESMGKAIPNAEIMVVREDGTECAPGEPGELVHRGSLVALGYWNDPEKTAERFRPAPGRPEGLPLREMAVWSGDQVRRDEEGYLYFISRKDEMIKTSGYRVSPSEVEEVIYASGLVREAVAIGVPHAELGQAILVLVTGAEPTVRDSLMDHCRRELPGFMLPQDLLFVEQLPRNPNGKIDRKGLVESHREHFG